MAAGAPVEVAAKRDKAALKKAKFHIGLGAKFFKKGKYAEALAEMRKANAAIPLPATVFNMARCYQEMGQYAEAVEYFQQYMAEGDNKKKLARTEAALAELIPKAFGSIEISCRPAGAKVQIAGVGAGACPYRKEQVQAGKWTMVTSADGYTDVRQELTIKAGERADVTVTLKRPGRLSVTTTPAQAKIYVDGKLAGEAPLEDFELPEGEHAVGIGLDGHRHIKRTVEVPGGDSVKVAVNLERLGGTLRLTSDPGGASVFVDGKDIGVTPLFALHLDPGEHDLRVEAGMHVPWARELKVKDEASLKMHAEMPSKLPTWILASVAGIAVAGGAVAFASAQGSYEDRDGVMAKYVATGDPAEAQQLGDEVRSLESGGDTMALVSTALFGAAVAAAGAAGWLWFSTPTQVSAGALR